MTTTLKLSDDLPLPLDVVTQRLGWLGRTGSGKTYGATKLAELMLDHDAQIVALDPVGVWYGLRLGSRVPHAFDIPVLGGLRGDIPLDPGAGALIADLIVDRNISAVLDVSQMLQAEQQRFATAFGERLFQRRKAAPSAMHIFLEECQEFVPQYPQRGQEHMLHQWTRAMKLGRNFGLGFSLLSQRPQAVHKEVLNQIELLLAFQMTGPQERKTIQGWSSEKGIGEDVYNLLPKLEIGCPRVWSPQWLKVTKTIRIARKISLDASSTPKVGAKTIEAKPLTPIDLAELREAMAATLEKAKADPKELRKRIAALEKELKAKPAAAPVAPKVVEVPILGADTRKEITRLTDQMQSLREGLLHALDRIAADCNRFKNGHTPATSTKVDLRDTKVSPPPTTRREGRGAIGRLADRVRENHRRDHGEQKLGKCERALLQVIAQRPVTTSTQLAILSGYSKRSSSFANALGALRSGGLAAGGGDAIRITDAGREEAGPVEPLPTGRALVDHWKSKLDRAERTLLEVLVRHEGRPISREQLSDEAGYSLTSSSYANAIGKLRTLELVEGRVDDIRASEALLT